MAAAAASALRVARVIVGSDHGGFALKQDVIAHIKSKGLECVDVGIHSPDRCDYPDIAKLVATQVVGHEDTTCGILLCGTGIGISIAANKIKGVRCALCHDHYTAQMSRQHNNANILAIGGRTTGPEVAKEMVDVFLLEAFLEGRHAVRVGMIHALESS